MPSGFPNVSVEIKYHNLRFMAWRLIAEAFGVHSFAARFTWWFLEPLMIRVADIGWKPVNIHEWFEGEL
jgi:hypothetical protein